MSNRLKLISGNWKMNLSPVEAIEYFSAIEKAGSNSKNVQGIKIIFAPAYCLGTDIQTAAKKAGFELGAQNVHWEEKGAFTAELSGTVLKKIGISWVLIGHSERRQFFGESNESCGKRLARAIQTGLNVVFCIGETLQERESGKMESVLKSQLDSYISVLKVNQPIAVVSIAYEPVWAIGTGKTATPEQAEEAHVIVRNYLKSGLGEAAANKTSILYGGSVTAENASTLLSKPNVDGGLVGGASLKPEQFIQICS